MRLLVQHRSHYGFPEPALLGPHLLRLRPASHVRAKVESYSLVVEQPSIVRWHQDPHGNHVARVGFRAGERHASLDVAVELVVELSPVNPFDFFVDSSAVEAPFRYAPELQRELAVFLAADEPGPLTRAFFDELPRSGGTVDLIVALNQAVNRRVRYVIREEAGTFTPEQTLREGRASCRDSATLLVELLRSRGLAARFVSGYLIQVADEGMLPDEPRGVTRDVVDLHAWAEVYLPGAGWIGLDATSGLLAGEGHIALACAASHLAAAPIEGTTSVAATRLEFDMRVARVGHAPRPTAPYTEAVWNELLAAAREGDRVLREQGITLTSGGEPTFTSRVHAEQPEWNTEALGPTKWPVALELGQQLRARLAPGALLQRSFGKQYPGESLPRWLLAVVSRTDGEPLWPDRGLPAAGADPTVAERFARRLAERLGVPTQLLPAREDPWRFLQEEAALPVDIDPLQADLKSSEDRRRLARVLDRGLGEVVGWVLPLARVDGCWVSERWRFRREHLFLVPGDSPIGLRLPLRALPTARKVPPLVAEAAPPHDPRSAQAEVERQRRYEVAYQAALRARGQVDQRPVKPGWPEAAALARDLPWQVRTALTVEPREGDLFVFLPPLGSVEDFIDLVGAVEAVRAELGVEVRVEGYPPPRGPALRSFSLAPDPGVLEVNVPPTAGSEEYVALMEQVFGAALAAGLCSEKYLVDGRLSGSGGGHHLTLGGPTPEQSPFLTRPHLLASLLTFHQHHPSLAYLFTGLFVGPSSQAPRVDEARDGQLDELELALARLARSEPGVEPPWLGDWLLRHLLVDLTGNTHRTEISIDKLYDWQTPAGRQGLLEFRAFEMPPHPRMAVAQMLLVRQLVAAFSRAPYTGRLARFGRTLHDRFLLPHWLWSDFQDVLGFLGARGLPLAEEAYRPFLELRCPLVGRVEAGGLTLEVRNALEPWHVLGEQLTASGTVRYVDSSLERIEVRVDGLQPERHLVMVNDRVLPLRATGKAGEYVAGVRFRAWAPPHALQPHLGVHHPLRLELLDTWEQRSVAACAYHVWHPEGRSFDRPPLTRFEASARRTQRFTREGPRHTPVRANPAFASPDAPYCLDLRRLDIDRPIPDPEPWNA